MAFGAFPAVSLADARERREWAKGLVAKGIDPKAYDKKQKAEQIRQAVNTFGSMAVSWFEHRKTRANFSEKHADQTWRRIKRHLFPHFEKMPITQITALQAIEALKPLQNDGKLSELKRVIQILNEVFNFALHRGIIPSNPCLHISKEFDAPKTEHFPTIRPEELSAFIARLRSSKITIPVKQAVLWQLLTMVRPTEGITAKWEDIDLDAKEWRFYVKKGAKDTAKGRLHIVTLCSQAIALLNEIRKFNTGSQYVFASPYGKQDKPRTERTVNKAMYDIGYKGELVAHGCRSIASTYLNEQGYDKDLVEVALSHIDKDRTRKAYNHAKYIPRRAEMLEVWGQFVENAYNQAE